MAFYSHFSIKHQSPCDPPTISDVTSRITHRISAPETNNTVRVFFVNMSEWSFRRDFTWQRHIHDFHEIIAAIEGRYRCILNGKEWELRPGQLLLIKPGDQHQDICLAGCAYIGFDFRIENTLSDEPVTLFKRLKDLEVERLQDWELEAIVDLRTRLRETSEMRTPEAMHLQDAYFAQFVWQVIERIPRQAKDPSFLHESEKSLFRMALLDLFERYAKTPVSLEALASGMGISRRSLTVKCDRYFSRSPINLFQEYRISKAAFLILRTSMPIKEIAYDMGFKNPFHFSRLFKHYLGKSPTTFREDFRAENQGK